MKLLLGLLLFAGATVLTCGIPLLLTSRLRSALVRFLLAWLSAVLISLPAGLLVAFLTDGFSQAPGAPGGILAGTFIAAVVVFLGPVSGIVSAFLVTRPVRTGEPGEASKPRVRARAPVLESTRIQSPSNKDRDASPRSSEPGSGKYLRARDVVSQALSDQEDRGPLLEGKAAMNRRTPNAARPAVREDCRAWVYDLVGKVLESGWIAEGSGFGSGVDPFWVGPFLCRMTTERG
jgi:hypothetical protein